MFDDLKLALKRMRNAPGFTVAAVLTLALAIGANTAIFSIADAVLFRPLPYRDPDAIHILRWANRRTGARATLMEYRYLQPISLHHRGLSDIGMLEQATSPIVVGPAGAEAVPMMAVTANYFQLLGVQALRGRLFDTRDASAPGRAAVLSYSAWRQRFGGDEHIVGRSVALGGTTFDIVGVLPSAFIFPSAFAGRPQIVTVMAPAAPGTKGGTFNPIVRREPGVTREQAQAEMDALVAPLLTESKPGSEYTPVLEDLRGVLYPTGRPIMTFVFAAAGLVLLIGCANLANMLLARSHRRERETGVCAALGASRVRLVRPVILEAVLIGLSGAALAVLVTAGMFDALLRQVPPVAYRGAPVGVDARVIVFALALGLLSGLFFSVAPAWRSASVDAQSLLQGRRDGGRRWRFGRPMVAVQVALAIVLMFGAVVAGRAFLAVLRVPLGFSPENVVTIRVWPRGTGGLALQNFYVQAVEAMARRGDVVSAGAAGSMPLDGAAADEGLELEGQERRAGIWHVLPGYFETVGIRLVRGRLLSWDDVRSSADVAVVAEETARILFADRDPLGQVFSNGRGRQFTIVGVVSNVRKSLQRESGPPAYVIPEDATRLLTLVVKTRGRQDAILADLKREVGALAPGTPVTAAWWTESIAALTSYRNPRFQTLVLASFATLALVLCALGVFSVVACLVAMRTREMGIRLAIGASPRRLIALMVRQALTPVMIGLVLGVVATRWAARLAEAQLFDVTARDPLTLVAAAITVTAAALLAAYLPARRASRIDPVVVLRAE